MKELIKSIVGPWGIKAIKQAKMLIKIIEVTRKGTWGKCEMQNGIRMAQHLEVEGKNVFFGYYDLQQLCIKE